MTYVLITDETERILKQRSGKDHAEARGQEITRLQKENGDLKTKLIGKGNTIIIQAKEIEELKESLRTITAMDKEEPCEQVEKLLNDVQDLTTRNRKLEDENESIHEELLIEKQRMTMLSASFEMLEYQKNVLEGEVKQANFILKMLCK